MPRVFGRASAKRQPVSLVHRKAAEFEETPGEAEADAVRDAFLRDGFYRGGRSSPSRMASTLTSVDPATRARTVGRLQEVQGNSFVNQLVAQSRSSRGSEAETPASPSPRAVPSVQRKVNVDVRRQSITTAAATELSDAELQEQVRILQVELSGPSAGGPEEEAMRSNLAVLEDEARRRQRAQAEALKAKFEIPGGQPAESIPLRGLRGLERQMAQIHNSHGKYLEQKAGEIGIPVADAAAFLKVESGGAGFARGTGLMIIRFENHKFYALWGKNNQADFAAHFRYSANKKWLGHRFRAGVAGGFSDVHSSQAREWEVFEYARGLDEDAAIQSISMGIAQILGSNYQMLGYRSPREMFDDMSGTLEAQFGGFFGFVSRRNAGIIVTALKAKDYKKAARYYNGKGKEAYYGEALRKASLAYEKVTAKPASVPSLIPRPTSGSSPHPPPM